MFELVLNLDLAAALEKRHHKCFSGRIGFLDNFPFRDRTQAVNCGKVWDDEVKELVFPRIISAMEKEQAELYLAPTLGRDGGYEFYISRHNDASLFERVKDRFPFEDVHIFSWYDDGLVCIEGNDGFVIYCDIPDRVECINSILTRRGLDLEVIQQISSASYSEPFWRDHRLPLINIAQSDGLELR